MNPQWRSPHLSIRAGTAAQAADYCKKDGMFVEHGTITLSREDVANRGEHMNEQFLSDLVSMYCHPLMHWMENTPPHYWGCEVDHWVSAFGIQEDEFEIIFPLDV